MAAGDDRSTLIFAAQAGDAVAIARLLSVCQADARRYARRSCMVGDIDDAVQETLMVVARKVRGLSSAAAFSAWLFTIIRRECRRLARAMLRHEPLEDEMLERQIALRSDEVLRLDLAAALESLPAHYLEVVLLRDFEEAGIAEIAERLGESASTVKSRLHRAREMVREYMLTREAPA